MHKTLVHRLKKTTIARTYTNQTKDQIETCKDGSDLLAWFL